MFIFNCPRVDKETASQEKLAEFRPSTQHVRLSKRETELVALIRKGLRTKEIADS